MGTPPGAVAQDEVAERRDLVALVALAFAFLALVWGASHHHRVFGAEAPWEHPIATSGDEPHYLVVLVSLLFDGDLVQSSSEDDRFAELVAAYSQDLSAAAWRSPTSSLLDVPGMELVRAVPSLGLPAIELDPTGATGAPR